MTWNYRLLAHQEGGETIFKIHEVYYNDKGIPCSYTENEVSLWGESVEELVWATDEIKKCFEKPVLSAEHFPKEI